MESQSQDILHAPPIITYLQEGVDSEGEDIYSPNNPGPSNKTVQDQANTSRQAIPARSIPNRMTPISFPKHRNRETPEHISGNGSPNDPFHWDPNYPRESPGIPFQDLRETYSPCPSPQQEGFLSTSSSSLPSPPRWDEESNTQFFYLPDDADITDFHPLTFLFQGRVFSSSYFEVKNITRNNQRVFLIAPKTKALKHEAILQLMQECIPYSPSQRPLTKSSKFRYHTRLFSGSGATSSGWSACPENASLRCTAHSAFLSEFVKNPSAPPRAPPLSWTLKESQEIPQVLQTLQSPKLTNSHGKVGLLLERTSSPKTKPLETRPIPLRSYMKQWT